MSSTLAIKSDGNLTVAGDGKTPNALLISGGSSVDTIHVEGDMFVSGAVDCGNKGKLASRFATADAKPNHLIWNIQRKEKVIVFVMPVLKAQRLQFIVVVD